MKKTEQPAKAFINEKPLQQNVRGKSLLIKKDLLIVLSIFLCAFLIRFIYLEQMKANPFFSYPIIDAGAYDQNAASIAMGKPTTDEKQAYFQAPLYTFFLAGVYKVFGHDYYIARIIQILISSFSCVLLFLITRMLFTQTTAIIAAAIYALYGTIIFYDCELLNPVLLVFFSLLGILLLLYASEKPRIYLWFLSGLAFGLSIIARENTLLFIPCVVVWIFLTFRKTASIKKITVYSAIFISALIIVMAPITLRNYIVENDIVMVSHTGGLNFYIGNVDNTEYYITLQPGYHWIELISKPEADAGKVLKSSVRSRWFFKETVRFIAANPGVWSKILLRKLAHFWNGYEFEPYYDIEYIKKFSSILRFSVTKFMGIYFPFGIIVPFALLGILLVLTNRIRTNQATIYLLLTYIVVFSTSLILFHVKARYRIPVIPFFILFAAYGIYHLFTIAQKKKYPAAVIRGILVLCAFVFLCNFQWYPINSKDYFPLHYYLARTYSRMNNYNAAIAEYKIALNAPLKDHDIRTEVYNELATIYIDQGKIVAAYAACKMALELGPDYNAALETMDVIMKRISQLQQMQPDTITKQKDISGVKN